MDASSELYRDEDISEWFGFDTDQKRYAVTLVRDGANPRIRYLPRSSFVGIDPSWFTICEAQKLTKRPKPLFGGARIQPTSWCGYTSSLCKMETLHLVCDYSPNFLGCCVLNLARDILSPQEVKDLHTKKFTTMPQLRQYAQDRRLPVTFSKTVLSTRGLPDEPGAYILTIFSRADAVRLFESGDLILMASLCSMAGYATSVHHPYWEQYELPHGVTRIVGV